MCSTLAARMGAARNSTLTLRIEPALKAALKAPPKLSTGSLRKREELDGPPNVFGYRYCCGAGYRDAPGFFNG
jgi:hypothetical protein